MRSLSILYRGPLSSCNYACSYCPFAKRRENRRQLQVDKLALQRFVEWASLQLHLKLQIFFTPWGEALVRRYYREAIETLCSLEQVSKVVIQTNLSAPLGFAPRCREKLAFWATYHPDWTSHDSFLAQCQRLTAWKVDYSVGVVGFSRFREAIARLRKALPESTYLWINAVKAELAELSPADREFFGSVDPHFELNTQTYPSLGRECGAGSRVISVDGDGVIRTCHFQPQPLGNIYDHDWEQALFPRLCQSQTCRCYIGYVHLDHLQFERVFGDGLLERIPVAGSSISSQGADKLVERGSLLGRGPNVELAGM